jgi:hypothetical protein
MMKSLWLLATLAVAMPAFAQDSPSENYNRDMYFGRQTCCAEVQDFAYDLNDFAVKARKIKVADIGNPGQLFLRRAGPDNAPYDSEPGQLSPGANIGHIAWQARTASGWDGRNAQIYARAVGRQTPSTSAGSLHFATTPSGTTDPVDRLVIEADGTLNLAGVPFDGDKVRVRLPDGSLGWIVVKREGSSRASRLLPWKWF